MSEPAPIQLRECVLKHLPEGSKVRSLERIPTGKFNSSYFAETDSGSYVLRVAPPGDAVFLFYERDMMRQEPEVHRVVLEQTGVPVARILAFDDTEETIDRNYLLMERLPGTALSQADGVDASRVLYETGACLAQVHKLTAERHGYLGAHNPMEPQRTWAEAFAILWRKLLEDIVGVGQYGQREFNLLMGLLDDHMALFDRPVAASLLHMDIWAQNLLVDSEGMLTGIVDWDRALWGDPEIEYAVLDYCGISEPPFWEGYGREREDSPAATIRRVFYILYELQKYIVIRAGRHQDLTAAQRYKQQSLGIVQRFFERSA